MTEGGVSHFSEEFTFTPLAVGAQDPVEATLAGAGPAPSYTANTEFPIWGTSGAADETKKHVIAQLYYQFSTGTRYFGTNGARPRFVGFDGTEHDLITVLESFNAPGGRTRIGFVAKGQPRDIEKAFRLDYTTSGGSLGNTAAFAWALALGDNADYDNVQAEYAYQTSPTGGPITFSKTYNLAPGARVAAFVLSGADQATAPTEFSANLTEVAPVLNDIENAAHHGFMAMAAFETGGPVTISVTNAHAVVWMVIPPKAA